jgi:N-acetylglucosaminyldiphosphoundecaprenol N-acetyl-beta-D-mannosaminyltransferase
MKIFDIELDNFTEDELRNELTSLLSDDFNQTQVTKVNTEFLLRTLNDHAFSQLLNQSTICLVDGRGVQWAARYLTLPISNNWFFRPIQASWQMIYSGAAIILNPKFITNPVREVLPGVEALKLMFSVAEKDGVGVFIFGAPAQVLETAITNLKTEFPRLKVAGTLNGYDFQTDKSIDPVQIINGTDAKLLIVGLGNPKQEYWIHENLPKLTKVKVAVGEGGTLDRIANRAQLAPKWLNRIGLEWLWRLLFNKSRTETRSRWGRFWNSVPVFIYEIVKFKIRNGAIDANS